MNSGGEIRRPGGMNCSKWMIYRADEKMIDINGDGVQDLLVSESCEDPRKRFKTDTNEVAYLRNAKGEILPLDRFYTDDSRGTIRFSFNERTLRRRQMLFSDWTDPFRTVIKYASWPGPRSFSIGDDVNIAISADSSETVINGGRIFGFAYDIDFAQGAVTAAYAEYVTDSEIDPTIPFVSLQQVAPTISTAERLRDLEARIVRELQDRLVNDVEKVQTAKGAGASVPSAPANRLSALAAEMVEREVADRFGRALVHTGIMRELGVYRVRWSGN